MVIRSRGHGHDVRILLVGERGVGKTSLILSLVSEEFPDQVPHRAEEITIPADVTPEHVPTHIVDFSAAEQNEATLISELRRANVICIVYAVDDENSLDSVTKYWLPVVQEALGEEKKTPLILVGNKSDLVDYTTMDAVVPIMNNYAEIETCVECSAKTLRNISEMFYYAQKAVLHPTGPLYVPEEKNVSLTERCKRALVRIFHICDADNDGILNDAELNVFQQRCFNCPLQPDGVEDVKAIVQRNVPEGVENNGLTLIGFLYLHCLFIQRGRHETTWTVLRKFGYTDSLSLDKEYLVPPLKVPPGCSTELSQIGFAFLATLFDKHDVDRDCALSPQELTQLFQLCPSHPWRKDLSLIVPTNEKGWLTYKGFQCQWAIQTLLDVRKTLECLAHLGYVITESENQLSAIQVTREKRLDLAKRQTSRNVYQCHVIGPRNSGKTTLCQGLLGRSMEESNQIKSTELPNFIVNTVQVYGQEKYLVLQDIDVHNVADSLMPSEVQCDVACLVYDTSDPKSFEYIARIYLKYFSDSKIPVLVVGNKSDLLETQQDYILQPTPFCQQHKLPPPQFFTSVGRIRKDIFVKLATMAAFPYLRRIVQVLMLQHNSTQWLTVVARHLKQLGLVPQDNLTWVKAGVGLAVVSIVGFLLAKAFKSEHR